MKKRVLLILFVLPFICTLKAQEVNNVGSILINVEKYPSFPGGEVSMKRFIDSLMIYPKSALEASLEGRVMLKFIVGKKGEISDISVIKSLSPECDSIAISIVEAMPNWDTPVNYERIYYSLPIHFKSPYSYKLVNDEKIYVTCEQMPSFPGGYAELHRYVSESVKDFCFGHCPHGRVTLQFIVNEEGAITNIKVIRGLVPDFDKEAIRVVESMPKWIPAKHRGENVKCYFTLPIIFRLQ